MTQWVHKARGYFRRFEEIALAGLLLLMILMATVQILLRNLFDTGLFWNETFLRASVLWLTLVGSMIATRDNLHIRIDLLQRYLSPEMIPWIERTVNLVAAFICGVVTWYSSLFVLTEYQYGASPVIPSWLVVSIIPFGFAIISVRFLGRALTLPDFSD